MKAMLPNGVPYLQMRLVGSRSTSGKNKERELEGRDRIKYTVRDGRKR